MNTVYADQINMTAGATHNNANEGGTVDTARTSKERAEAIQQVYEAHIESIYKFVYFKVGNREDAEDITSQIFIKAAHSLDIRQDERSRLAWLYQVARTTITDYWRQYYKGPTSSLEAMEESSPLHLAAEPVRLGEFPDVETSNASDQVSVLLNLLPDNYRTVLHFRFLKGYSLKETAAAMQTTEANVKVLQHRALQKAVKVSGQAQSLAQYQ